MNHLEHVKFIRIENMYFDEMTLKKGWTTVVYLSTLMETVR